MKPLFHIALTLCLMVGGIQAKRTHSFRTEIWTPEEELAGFELPDGFVIELVASEVDGIVNPIDLAFDDGGRLWTQTAAMYPLDPVQDILWNDLLALMDDPDAQKENPAFRRALDLYEGVIPGNDRILIIEDPWAEKPSKPRVWAEGLTIPQSILPYKNGAYVAQGSELFFLSDKNGDGSAERRTRLLTNFGITDSHTMSHLLVRGPGDWIHFSQGALNKGEVKSLVSGATTRIDYSKIIRMSLDGAQFNVVSAGLNNIWGFQLRANGQWYATEANDLTWSVVPMEPGSGIRGIGNQRIRPYQPWIPELHDFRVGGTGISGLEFSEDGEAGFPPEWKDVAILANPITSTLNCVRIVRNPDGTVSAEHLPDLLKSRDDWFRPVNLEFGPDGCLYIADWYNKIISHNELPRSHPERDKSHGRIWRVRHESQKPGKIPNLYQVATVDLVTHLKAPTLWEKRAAWHQITERGATELSDQLIKLAKDKTVDVITRIHALWSLEGLKHFSISLMDALLKAKDGDLRREAIRSLASFDIAPSKLADYLDDFLEDPNVMVRSQLLRTLADYGQANHDIIDILVSYCRPDIPGLALGGSYERTFERYLARMALEQYQEELIDYLETTLAEKQPAERRFWAIQALPLAIREPYFLDLWETISSQPWDEPTFLEIVNALEIPAIFKAVEPSFHDLSIASNLASLAADTRDRVTYDDLGELLKPAVTYLLNSRHQADQEIGLEAADAYNIQDPEAHMIRLLESPESNATVVNLAIGALSKNPSAKARTAFGKLLGNRELSFELRLASLNALLRGKGRPDSNALQSFAEALDDAQKWDFINALSTSRPGAESLLALLDDGVLLETDFDTWILERMLGTNLDSTRLSQLHKRRQADKKARFEDTFNTFMEIAESGEGDSNSGKSLFTGMCLSCHNVGSEGVDWAPALDGSGYRDNEALLTAILDPDAAVEGPYAIRRVHRNDGTVLEGYLEKSTDRGVTLRFMGGGSLFVPTSDIKAVQQLRGRSTMPGGLVDNLPPDQVADLLAYIRTLQ